MLSLLTMLDAAPTPAVLMYMVLGMAGFFVLIGLITVSVMLIVRAIKKKKKKNNDTNSDA